MSASSLKFRRARRSERLDSAAPRISRFRDGAQRATAKSSCQNLTVLRSRKCRHKRAFHSGRSAGTGNISWWLPRIYRPSALRRAPGRSVGRSVRPIDRYRKLSVMSLRRLARNTPDSARSKAPPCVHARSPAPWLRAVISHCGKLSTKCLPPSPRCSRRGEIATKCLLRLLMFSRFNPQNAFFAREKFSIFVC